MAKPTKPTEAKSQPEQFIKTASRLECDEDKKQFEEKAEADRETEAREGG